MLRVFLWCVACGMVGAYIVATLAIQADLAYFMLACTGVIMMTILCCTKP